jgi:hypothetical protein
VLRAIVDMTAVTRCSGLDLVGPTLFTGTNAGLVLGRGSVLQYGSYVSLLGGQSVFTGKIDRRVAEVVSRAQLAT